MKIVENAGQASVTISDAEDRNAREYQLTSLAQSFLPNLIEEVGKTECGSIISTSTTNENR